MKITRKPLRLARETVRHLSPAQLALVDGGTLITLDSTCYCPIRILDTNGCGMVVPKLDTQPQTGGCR